jgi:hypothetical protein
MQPRKPKVSFLKLIFLSVRLLTGKSVLVKEHAVHECCRQRLVKSFMHVKKKAVLLHAMEAHGGKGGIAPTHS